MYGRSFISRCSFETCVRVTSATLHWPSSRRNSPARLWIRRVLVRSQEGNSKPGNDTKSSPGFCVAHLWVHTERRQARAPHGGAIGNSYVGSTTVTAHPATG